MSVLGPISTMQAAGEASLLSTYDFSTGYTDAEVLSKLTLVRASGAGCFDEQGNYRVVGVNEPVIGFDTFSKKNGLILDPSATNGLVVSASNPLGFNAGNGIAFDTPVRGPDGKLSAFRVQGKKAGQPPSVSNYTIPAGAKGVSLTGYVRHVPGGEALYKMTLRNQTSASNFLSATLDLTTGAVTGNGTGQVVRAHRFPNGWWEFVIERDMTGLAEGDQVTAYMLHDGNRGYLPIDLWYHQLEANPYATSLIIPSSARATRTSILSGSAINMAEEFANPGGLCQIIELSKRYLPGAATGYIGGYLNAQRRAYVTFNATSQRMAMVAQYDNDRAATKTAPNNTFFARCGFRFLAGKPIASCVNGALTTGAGGNLPEGTAGIVNFLLGGANIDGRTVLHWVKNFGQEIDLARYTRI
ncbi:phage head spike fiber domain-containing protein [Kerstersia gyiorum]|nr:hypothetical protein [Kerstersia gyiorum]